MESRIGNASPEAAAEAAEQQVRDLKALLAAAREKASESAKAADEAIRGHPYQALGVALGLGLIIGVLLGKKFSDK